MPSTSTISQIPSPSPPPAVPHPHLNSIIQPPSLPITANNGTIPMSDNNDSGYDQLDVNHNYLGDNDGSLNFSSPTTYGDNISSATGMDDTYFSSLESMIDPGSGVMDSTMGSSDVPMDEGSPVFDFGDESLMGAISYSPLSNWNSNSSE